MGAEPLLIKYGQRLVKEAIMEDRFGMSASGFYQQFRDRVKSESFTNNFKEYVGIDNHNDGCDFEVELQGELKQVPMVSIFDYFISDLLLLIRLRSSNTTCLTLSAQSNINAICAQIHLAATKKHSSATCFMLERVVPASSCLDRLAQGR
jgi:hypothetical protein